MEGEKTQLLQIISAKHNHQTFRIGSELQIEYNINTTKGMTGTDRLPELVPEEKTIGAVAL